MLDLFQTFFFFIQFWTPLNIKNADMLGEVQRRATKKIPSLRNLTYEEKLISLGIFSLSRRRLRGDMIEVFKMVNGIEKVNEIGIEKVNLT